MSAFRTNQPCVETLHCNVYASEARKINPDFAWQPRFYDHIISDDASFQRITSYIAENPAQWSYQWSVK